METIKIDYKTAARLRTPFLKSSEKKALGINGYQMFSEYGWCIEKETSAAILFSGTNETGNYAKKEIYEVQMWLPKSQIKVFEYVDIDEDDYDKEKSYYIVFVKTWLFNQEKNNIQLNHFKSYAYA